MSGDQDEQVVKEYVSLPTLRRFHESPGQIRCIVGPVGSGKTSAAAWEVCYYLPKFLFQEYGFKKTRGVVVRNTYSELMDTTFVTIQEWFPFGTHAKQRNIYTIPYDEGFAVELMLRACDRAADKKKFKSLELTWYWIDESIEVDEEIKRMLKGRIGRYPPKCPVRFGIETTNPPDVEHSTYTDFKWDTPPPGPVSSKIPLASHLGFWQPAGENKPNLRPGYYEDMTADYRDNPDWVATYIESKPGIMVIGKLVYNNFSRVDHVAKENLIWAKGPLIRGWDDSGNLPACIVLQVPRPHHIQILREFYHDKMGVTDFGTWVKEQCALLYPGAEFTDWDDPAGHNEYSKKEGGFTSNAKILKDVGIKTMASEQNWAARKESVEGQLARREGILIDPSCVRLINGFMGGYCYPQVGTTGRYADMPIKNRFAHIHDALQYALVKIVGAPKRDQPRQTVGEMDFDAFNPFAEHRGRQREADMDWSPFEN